uniref:Putative papain-like cysteine prorease n=1 Tax=Plasmodium fragile TaxID=5857 RepID=F1SZ20_PLAFR|nr:putative papain-like cysteine prorease [Plasmodium fragile]
MRSCVFILLLTYAALNGRMLLNAETSDQNTLSPESPSHGVTSPTPVTPNSETPQNPSPSASGQNGSHNTAVPGTPQGPQGATHTVTTIPSAHQGAHAGPQQQAPALGGSGPPREGTHETTHTSVGAPESSSSNDGGIQVKTALLKDANGVKVTGPCGANFEISLVPHMSISAETSTNDIKLRPKLHKLSDTNEAKDEIMKLYNAIQFGKNPEKLKNKCQPGKGNEQTFKFLVLIHEGELTLKWKVYDKSAPPRRSKDVDVRTYILNNMDQPITTIQVHSSKVNDDTLLVETKSYYVKRDIPEKCDTIATDCYLNGNVDVEKCFQCTLLIQNKDTTDECFKYVSSEVTDKFQDIKVNAQDEEDTLEDVLTESIGKILQGMYKKGQTGMNQLLSFDQANKALKAELLNYCASMKEVDSSGVLDNYELGSAQDVFVNITNMLHMNSDCSVSSLQNKLKNPALCLKNTDQWVDSKKGLLLPSLAQAHVEATPSATPKVEHMSHTNDGMQNVPYDAIINLVSAEEKNNGSSLIEDSMYCNDEYCDRWKDDTSCMSKIEAEDQGVCATSWLFASKLHLETIKCMKGYEHIPSSALYVANCLNNKAHDKCQAPSNPLEFLNTLEETKFLPTNSNLPYSYKAVNNVCPQPNSHWKNLWANVTLLDPQYQPNSVSTKGYTAYQSAHFNGNMDAFIKLVKSEVMNKGSVIAYVKAAGALSYDLNGKKVLSLCGGKTPDLAVNIIGYGNYINEEGMKKSYWLLRNSWGSHWGDDGNFKVDMHGPHGCQQNFIHTAAVFNLDVPIAQSVTKKNNQLYSYYLKGAPDLYENLYYKGFGSQCKNTNEGQKGQVGNLVVSGQTEEVEAHESGQGEGQNQAEVQAGQGGAHDGVAQSGTGVTLSPPAASSSLSASPSNAAKITQVLHILKHVKHGKVKTGLVTYEGDAALSAGHACSRAVASDPDIGDDECVKFCDDNWNECKDKFLPTYCLTNKRGKNDCFFCYV